jgi:outer membrane receptor protein involved in Fe transport
LSASVGVAFVIAISGTPGFAAAPHGTSVAQADQPDDAGDFDEIVVTAQKRSERLSDVPLSITAATGADLTKRGITSTADLAKVVPGFSYQLSNYGTPVFTIRGIGFYDVAMGTEPAVTAYVDQVPLPYSIMTRGTTLDLERVEALKGPQGILFGQNSTGGAINYIAAKPTRDLHYGGEASYGRFNEYDVEAFASGPVTDTLAARIALRHEGGDGWQKSLTRPSDALGKRNFTNARLLVDWTPSSAARFELSVSGWQDKSDTQAAQFLEFAPLPVTPATQNVFDVMSAIAPAPERARAADWTPGLPTRRDSRFGQISLRGDFDVTDDIVLTSITAYSKLTAHEPFDNDGVAYDSFNTIVNDGKITSFFQELRMAGQSGPLRWVVGGNFQRDSTKQFQTVQSESSKDAVGPFIFLLSTYSANQQPTTVSAFGNLEYALTTSLTATAGLRYSAQDRKFNGCMGDAGDGNFANAIAFLATIFSGEPRTIAPGGCVTLDPSTFQATLVRSHLDEDNLSWRVGLNWKPGANQLIYANVTKGYKSGAYSILPGAVTTVFDPVTQESLLAYEAGFKTGLFELPVRLSGAAFYYDYRNKQLVGFGDVPVFRTVPKLINIPKSRVYGAELELSGRPLPNLNVSSGITYVNSRVQQDPRLPALTLTPFGLPTSYVGEAFPNTPRWQAVGDVEQTIPTKGNISFFAGGSITYRSGAQAAFGEAPQFRIDPYTLIDLRAGVQDIDGKWRIQVWGLNVTNKYYWINVGRPIDSVSRYAGRPATYGITASARY